MRMSSPTTAIPARYRIPNVLLTKVDTDRSLVPGGRGMPFPPFPPTADGAPPPGGFPPPGFPNMPPGSSLPPPPGGGFPPNFSIPPPGAPGAFPPAMPGHPGATNSPGPRGVEGYPPPGGAPPPPGMSEKW